MMTANADPLQYGISPEEMAIRLIEQPDWSWDETQTTGTLNEDTFPYNNGVNV